MIKNLLPLCMAAFTSIGAMATTATMDYTYAEGALSGYGKGKAETIDVAICINDPSLAGMKVTGIKAYVNTLVGLSKTSVWGSKELQVANKLNVPDLFSYDVAPVAATVGDYDMGVLDLKLEEPYVLTAEPLYLGYTMTVDAVENDAQRNPIVISEGYNADGFYLHMSKSVLKWMAYSENAGGVAYIVATIEGDFPDNSLGFKGYDTIYAEEDKGFSALFSVSNIGANAIESVKYVYSVDGGAKKEGNAQLVDAVEPSLTFSSSLSLPFDGISGIGPHDLNVEITEVNGQPNVSSAAAVSCVVNVIPFMPVHRPLVEEYTGLWCGWCPRGYLAMEWIAEDFGEEEVSICYHNGDPMEVTAVYPMNIGGFPSASIDRLSVIDPYYGSYNDREFGIASDLENAMDKIAIASVDVTASLEGNTVNLESTVKFIQDIEGANYQIGYVLVCNGLKSPEWYQSNYFAGSTDYDGTPLEVLQSWGKKQGGLVFNDVAVDVSGMSGVAGSLPSSIVTGNNYTHSYSFDITDNPLVQNTGNLVATVFVIDKSTGKIVNANKASVGTSGVMEIASDRQPVSREFFDLTGRRVANPGKGIYILKERYSDGTSRSGKVLMAQ